MKAGRVFVVATLLAAAAPHAAAQDGAAAFGTHCATCHGATGGGQPTSAPSIEALRRYAPEAILNSLLNGKMRLQGAPLTDADRRGVAEFLGGRALRTTPPGASVTQCQSSPPFPGPGADDWNGWGNGLENTRFARSGGLVAADLPRLKLKWAFGYADATSARAQPAHVGNRLFVASDTGDVHALDPRTACAYWSFRAQATVRTALLVAPYRRGSGGTGWAVFFGDLRANAYAVDATSGDVVWIRRVDEHPSAAITGSLIVHDGVVFVPAQGLNEEVQGGRPQYECCTFRGSVSALDAGTGAVLWKAYTLGERQSRGANAAGVPQWGPAGGGIWAAPTVDPRRGALYVATGNGYAEPEQPTTDAVLAIDMKTGAILWASQPLKGDVWAGGCRPDNPDNPNCPAKLGPDHDFSASPILTQAANGKTLLVIQQKSGMAYAFDPDNKGALVWQYRTSAGGGLGGQWGAAVDGRQAYFSINGSSGPAPGGIRAVELATGKEVWTKPASERLCGTERGCSAVQGAAVTAIPGIVFSGSMDGGVRAYASDDGSLVWQFDTNRAFPTVNGVKANGGAMDGPGPIVAGGMLFVNSGYVSLIGRPGNVLLAFGVD